MFARFFDWHRLHPWFADLMLMLPIATLAWATRPTYVHLPNGGGPRSLPLAIHLVLLAAACLPMVWRRRWPRAVFAIVAVVAFVQWLAGITIGASDIPVMISMYTVAAQCAFRWALAAGLT